MTKREKTIALFVGVAAGLLVLDQYILGPYFARLSTADDRIAAHQTAIADANNVLQRRLQASRHWRDISAGLVKADSSAAESQLLNRVRDCAGRASLQIASNKTEKGEKEKGYDRVSVKYTATGSMQQIARFLYELQITDIPVRVNDLTVVSRKEGTDDLNVALTLSTIYQAAAPAKVAMSAGGWGTFQ